MAPQPPLLLVDNLFDTITQYPLGTLTTSSERVGHEAFRVADYRRERTSWQAATVAANHWVQVDLGAGVARACDSLFIDRGHNLWGTGNVALQYSDTGSAWTNVAVLPVPVLGTLGGDPNVGFSVTEEGALYVLTAAGAHRWWRILVVPSLAPVIPGLILGMRTQLINYSTTFDEDAGERTENTTTSTAGYRAADTTYSWRTSEVGLALIGATEYDNTIRALREKVFARNQPYVLCMDYGTRPERAWMYQLDGRSWGMAKKRVYREGRLRGREVGASLP